MYVDPEELKAFRRALEEGIALFDQQRFVDAYEVWEARWAEETTDGADLLQGLLKMAVGCAKLQGRSPRSALKLFDGALDKISLYAPAAYGLDVDALVTQVRQLRAQALAQIDASEH